MEERHRKRKNHVVQIAPVWVSGCGLQHNIEIWGHWIWEMFAVHGTEQTAYQNQPKIILDIWWAGVTCERQMTVIQAITVAMTTVPGIFWGVVLTLFQKEELSLTAQTVRAE